MTIKCVLLGRTTQIVKSLAKLLLQVVGHGILVAEKDHTALGDYATNGQFSIYIHVDAFKTVNAHL